MIYLLDSDAIKKLAQYDLLLELGIAYDSEPESFAVLPELKYQLHLGNHTKAVDKLGSQKSYEALNSFLARAKEVLVVATSAANEILELNQSNLDIGEQTLLAAMASSSDNQLISGDKRAFVAISKIVDCAAVESMWPRFICLEEALHAIIETSDFTIISSKIRSRPDVDSAMKMAFGVSAPSNQSSVIGALKSFIEHLTTNTNGLYQTDNNRASSTA